MDLQGVTLFMMPEEELDALKSVQQEILQQLKQLNGRKSGAIVAEYITAKEFMKAVSIGRTKFDQLVNASKIKIVKKRRKIYVPFSEMDRYFKDANIL